MLRAMTDLAKPLTDAELDRLDSLLLDRIDEHAATEGADEGVLGVSELDGFLTAVVSGPATIVPSRWLPVLYGDFEPVWDRPEESEAFLSLVMRHMNEIALLLLEYPEDFAPIYLESETPKGPVLVVDEWCEGYMRGVGMSGPRRPRSPISSIRFGRSREKPIGSRIGSKTRRQWTSCETPSCPMSLRSTRIGSQCAKVRSRRRFRSAAKRRALGATTRAAAAAVGNTRNAAGREGATRWR
jgi:hypothetical protein